MSSIDLNLFLRDLWQQGVELWLEGEQLRFRGNKDIVTGDTLTTLRQNKPAIIELLKQKPQAFLGFPLSYGQRAIYMMQNLASDSHAYNLACLLKLSDALDIETLQTSFDLLLQRHAPLRMSIVDLDGQLAQQVSYSLPSILSIDHDLVVTEDDWQDWISATADKPFQLDSEPLIRARLLQNSQSPYHNHLLIVAHHIIADFWTLELIIKELDSIYLASLTEKPLELSEIGLLYKDYVIHEKNWLDSRKGHEAKSYWHDKLTPLPPALELPADFSRPAEPSFKGKEVAFRLGKELTGQIKNRAREEKVTPFVWVLSCYQLLLHLYTNEDIIAVGSPVACRTQKDFQLLAGHFTNPVVLLNNFSENPVFQALLESNKSQTIQSLKHQEYPLQKLIEELQPGHSLDDSPLFQTAISWNQLHTNTVSDGALIDDIILMEQRGAIYNIVLTCFDRGDDIQLSWRFNTERFKQSSINRAHQHLEKIIEQSLINPLSSCSEFSILTSDEIVLLAGINATEKPYDNNRNIAAIFRDVYLQNPDAEAFRHNGSSKTYEQLETDSNRIAHFLNTQSLKAGDAVALCIPRSYDMLACLLACLKAGIIYIPIDPTFPLERITSIYQAGNCQLLFCCKEDATILKPVTKQASIITLDHLQKSISGMSKYYNIFNQGIVEDDTVACLFFTSGSTGKPKGVQVPHRAAARLMKNTNYIKLGPDDRFCHFSNVSFDASNIEIWGALLNGGCLLCIDNDTLLNPEAFYQFVKSEKPTACFITTALFNLLVLHKPDVFKDMKYLLFGGEVADSKQVRHCLQFGKPEHLMNVYGPTENGSLSSFYEISGELDNEIIPIGYPIGNTQIYIHNRYGKQAAVGVVGEIVVGGEGIAIGYIKQPELTAEKFIPDKYRKKGMLYKTGDLGFIREDGAIVYSGRIDDLVKIRGYRIELGEIEQAIVKIPTIKECYITVINKDTSPQLAAYFTATEQLDPVDIRQEIHSCLPDYMLPSAFMQLDELPLNANGKIDKNQLPEIISLASEDYVAPRNDLESLLASTWQEVLGIEKIGIHDNFFELGGHSLLAVKTASAIQSALGLEVTMRLLFQHPDIASLASAIKKLDKPALPAIMPVKDKHHLPASMVQQRLWFLQQLNPGLTAYNMPVAIAFDSIIKPSFMEQCISDLVNRHESLRTGFIDDQGIAYLKIADPRKWPLQTLDLSQLKPLEAERQARQQINLLVNHVFDLEKPPLVKALMIAMPESKTYLAFCLHHIIVDGWSIDILVNELSSKLGDKTGTPLEQLDIQYSDFSEWQRHWLQGDILEKQRNYWQQQLKEAPGLLNIPTDKPRPPVLSSRGFEYRFSIPEALVKRLQALGNRNNASLFMVLIGTYSILLSRYSQQTDICVGFPISGRHHPQLEKLTGLFVNNLVMRANMSGNPGIDSFFQSIRDTVIGAYSHQDIPFDMIIDALDIERSLSYTPFLQASFSLEKDQLENQLGKLFDGHAKLVPLDWHIAKYDLNLTCYETPGNMQASIEYSADLFEQETIERMARHFTSLLESLCIESNTYINQLQLISEQEMLEFSLDWQEQRELNKRTYINAINRFEIQAGKFARKTALVYEDKLISYEQLNNQANQLARYLVDNGIGNDTYVGLYMERSIDLVISLLAILKTGAAYIPLDPYSPADRINFIINDADIRHVISTTNLSPAIQVNAINLDDIVTEISSKAKDNLNIHIPLEASAYVIYTSGTTGKPKGCVISHRNLARLFTITENKFGFSPDDVWTLFHSYAFDFSVWEIWGALLYGGKLVVVPHWLTRSPEDFYELLIREKVTILNQTPSAFSQIIAVDQSRTSNELTLKTIIFGGEALDFSALKQWVARHPLEDIELVNMYGITETTVHVTYHAITNEDLNRGRSVIGRPLDDLHIMLLDPDGKMVPTGVMGEMFISGAGVTKGYLHRPELTQERFIDNPFITDMPNDIAEYHQRMYRSGDLARRLKNGDIEYMGRIDHQVKIRGHRIELGEIEAVLSSLQDIHESIVVAAEDATGHRQLVAYLLVDDPGQVDLQQIKQQLKSSLPEYMLPAAYIGLRQWPLTANGKIDKQALPPPGDSIRSTVDYIAPRNDTELAICAIWSDILGMEKVGINDNFFELGGHSLLATRVASRIRSQLDCSLELKSIFEYPTVSELAVHILESEIDALDLDDESLMAMLEELNTEENPE